MKKTRYTIVLSTVMAAVMLFLTACGASSSGGYSNEKGAYDSSYVMHSGGDMYYAPQEAAGMAMDEDMYAEAGSSENKSTNTQDIAGQYGLKIIYTANLNIETLEYDECYKNIMSKVREVGGYVENSNEDGGYRYSSNYSSRRYLDLTVRIPVDKYSEFLTSVEGYGNLISKSESSQDITSQYMDTEARLKALEGQRDRLEELALKAEDIETLLAIETQLSEVQYQIENYTSQKNFYDNKVSFTTVYIYLQEVKVITDTENTFWSRLKDTFRGSWSSLGETAEGLLFGLIYALPYLILIAIIVVVIIRISKKAKKKRLAKYQQPAPAVQPAKPAQPVKAEPEHKTEEQKEQKEE